jgi:hypothetical protein
MKARNKIIKFILTILSVGAFSVYAYYYPAPQTFSRSNFLPIAIFILLFSLTIFLISYFFTTRKNSVLITATVTATLFLKIQRFIPIITYAITLPLLFLHHEKDETDVQSPHPNQEL